MKNGTVTCSEVVLFSKLANPGTDVYINFLWYITEIWSTPTSAAAGRSATSSPRSSTVLEVVSAGRVRAALPLRGGRRKREWSICNASSPAASDGLQLEEDALGTKVCIFIWRLGRRVFPWFSGSEWMGNYWFYIFKGLPMVHSCKKLWERFAVSFRVIAYRSV